VSNLFRYACSTRRYGIHKEGHIPLPILLLNGGSVLGQCSGHWNGRVRARKRRRNEKKVHNHRFEQERGRQRGKKLNFLENWSMSFSWIFQMPRTRDIFFISDNQNGLKSKKEEGIASKEGRRLLEGEGERWLWICLVLSVISDQGRKGFEEGKEE